MECEQLNDATSAINHLAKVKNVATPALKSIQVKPLEMFHFPSNLRYQFPVSVHLQERCYK